MLTRTGLSGFDRSTIHNIFIDEERGHAWLVGTNNGARIVDLADPVNPVEIGDFQARYIHDVYVKNGFAYFSEIFSGIHETVDATDVSNLQILASWATPTNFTHNSWTNEDDTIIVTSDETAPGGHMGVYDISNKNVPPPLISEYIPNPASLVPTPP